MALFSEAVKKSIEKNELYECDNCKAKFSADKVVLRKTSENIAMVNPMLYFVFVDYLGRIVGGNESPSKSDKVFHCPNCDHPHLFGFNKVKVL